MIHEGDDRPRSAVPSDTYICAQCGGEFEKVSDDTWSDAKAEAEAEFIFGLPSADWRGGVAVVCDDCFKAMDPDNNPALVNAARELIKT